MAAQKYSGLLLLLLLTSVHNSKLPGANLRARGSPVSRAGSARRKNKGLACISRHGQSSPGGRVEDTRAAARQQLSSTRLHERAHRERLHAWRGGSCGWYRRGKGGRVTWGESGALPRTPSQGCGGAPSSGVCRKTSDGVNEIR